MPRTPWEFLGGVEGVRVVCVFTLARANLLKSTLWEMYENATNKRYSAERRFMVWSARVADGLRATSSTTDTDK